MQVHPGLREGQKLSYYLKLTFFVIFSFDIRNGSSRVQLKGLLKIGELSFEERIIYTLTLSTTHEHWKDGILHLQKTVFTMLRSRG